LSPTTVIWTLFFFFQAEDGIRAFHVTGVQTCALPIFGAEQLGGIAPVPDRCLAVAEGQDELDALVGLPDGALDDVALHAEPVVRSEERRVGKVCLSSWEVDTASQCVSTDKCVARWHES